MIILSAQNTSSKIGKRSWFLSMKKVVAFRPSFGGDQKAHVKNLYFINQQCIYKNEGNYKVKSKKETYTDSLKKITKLY